MTPDDVQRWLDAYVAAWRSNDRDDIVALFNPAATYRYAPWKEPIVGAEAIADSWLEEPDDPAGWTATYHPHHVAGDRAFAIGSTAYPVEAKEYANLFDLRFDAHGRCVEFVEWYMKRPSTS